MVRVREIVIVLGLTACSFELRPAGEVAIDAGAIDTVDAHLTPRTLRFREGLDGYAGTLDNYISDNVPGPHGAEDVFIWDRVSDEEHALLQFTGVFGTNPAQVPPGSTIVAASLRIVIVEPTASVGIMREVAIAWDEATMWSAFGSTAGVQPEDVGVTRGPAPTTGASMIDVTASVAAWSADPAANHGWLFSPGGDDGCDVASSEATAEVQRPTLEITYVAP